MINPDNDQLWRDSLDEGMENALAAESLAEMLAYARCRRRRRRMLGVSATAGAFAVLLGLAWRPSHPPQRLSAVDRSPSASTGKSENAGLAQIHFLTDDELLSRFPDRPVALIGPPGDRRLVFLDHLP